MKFIEFILVVKDELPDFATKVGFWLAVFGLVYTICIHNG